MKIEFPRETVILWVLNPLEGIPLGWARVSPIVYDELVGLTCYIVRGFNRHEFWIDPPRVITPGKHEFPFYCHTEEVCEYDINEVKTIGNS